jgi:arginase family enzyme
VHAAKSQFILHFDVDTINGDEFPWTNSAGKGGLGMNEVRDALREFVSQPNLAAFEVAGYNPDLDPDAEGARKLIDLLANVLSARLEAMAAAAAGASDAPLAPSVSSAHSSDVAPAAIP